MSKPEEEKLRDILDQIGEDSHLSQVLEEFNEDVYCLHTRKATFVTLIYNFLDRFSDLTRIEKIELIGEVEKLGITPTHFLEIIDRNSPFLIAINPKQPYKESTLKGYYDFLNYADYLLETASLGNMEFGKEAFPNTTNITLEEARKIADETLLLLSLRDSLRTDKSGFTALRILAEEWINQEVPSMQLRDPPKKAAYIQGINIFIHDYQLLFTSLSTERPTIPDRFTYDEPV
ncbi:hypothetical protein HZB96_01530 [Candidatus Gottesmanbacteria bacterium]|nr:hypothetical protein [Candidatus Gottesmanbacteria bacterium]